MAKVLTAKAVENAKAGAARREIPDGGCRGLYLIVQPSGAKSWALRYRFAGRPAKLTLGTVLVGGQNEKESNNPTIGGTLTLAAARKLAADASHQLGAGRDPNAAKRAARIRAASTANHTLKSICEEYLQREGWKLRTAEQRRAIFDRLIYPKLGTHQIDTIKRTDIVSLLDGIEDKCGPRMADYSLAVLQRVLNWYASRSEDYRNPIVRGMTRLKQKETARDRILSDDELRTVWKATEKFEQPTFGRFVRFLLLTAARKSEAARMCWNEIEDEDWTLPASRNKVKLDLVRPLSLAVQALLSGIPKFDQCAFVFTADAKRPIGGFSKFKASLDRASGVTGWTLHDLRRTARSLMSRAGVQSDHAERCLGHVMPGIRGTYDRHEYHAEKRRAYEALAMQIERIVDRSQDKVVTPLPRKS